MADDFDFYISPSDRFQYETQFTRYSGDNDEVTLQQLDSFFQISRLSMDEFLQIWNVCDIKGIGRLNEEQFIMLAHILNSRRRGKSLPTGLPLNVKELFLKEDTRKSHVYVRPSVNSSSPPAGKAVESLETDLAIITGKVAASKSEHLALETRISDLKVSKEELRDLQDYKRRQATSLQDDLSRLASDVDRDTSESVNISGGGEDVEQLLADLRAKKAWLEARRSEVLRLTEQVQI